MGFPSMYPCYQTQTDRKEVSVIKKKIFIRGLIGFITGVAMMFVVPAIINQGSLDRVIYTEAFLKHVGNNETAAMLLTMLIMGLFGACCFWGTLFYEIERWPLALATIAHYLLISAGYLIPNWLLCWDMPMKLLMTIEVFMMIGFFIIWMIIYCVYKREVRELNQLQKQMHTQKALEEKA